MLYDKGILISLRESIKLFINSELSTVKECIF